MINPLLKFRTMGVPPQKLDQTVQANPGLMQSALGRAPVDPSILAPQEGGGGMDNMAMMLAMQHMMGGKQGRDPMFPNPVRQFLQGAPGEQMNAPGAPGYVPGGTTLTPFDMADQMNPWESSIPGGMMEAPFVNPELMPAEPGLLAQLSNKFKTPAG